MLVIYGSTALLTGIVSGVFASRFGSQGVKTQAMWNVASEFVWIVLVVLLYSTCRANVQRENDDLDLTNPSFTYVLLFYFVAVYICCRTYSENICCECTVHLISSIYVKFCRIIIIALYECG